MEPVKVNIGCGTNLWDGFVNIDSQAALKPDIVLDIRYAALPFKDGYVDELWMCHTIEHIEYKYHNNIFSEIHRVLCYNGRFILTFPNFEQCARNYLSNYKGQKEFWAHTIFGAQNYKGDYHVCAVEPQFMTRKLEQFGFQIEYSGIESEEEPFNWAIKARKVRDICAKDTIEWQQEN